jgi:hypothetical protein
VLVTITVHAMRGDKYCDACGRDMMSVRYEEMIVLDAVGM